MKTALTLAVLGLFSAAIIGCEASASVGHPDDTSTKTTTYRDNGDSSYKKTTTVSPDGDRTTTTIKREDR